MTNVLFVCLGNICRSPMAESMFSQMVADAGRQNEIAVDSAGTSDWEEGNPAHPGTIEILRNHQLPFKDLVSRPLNTQDFIKNDFIICMDNNILSTVKAMKPANSTAQINMIFDQTPTKKGQEVPDPWYTHNFQATYDDLATALPDWLKTI